MEGFALNNIQNCYVGSAPATAIYLGSNKIWPTINPYETQYLTFEAINNNVKFCLASMRNDGSLIVEYSLDDGSTWNNLVCTTASPDNGYATYTPTIQTGAKILWRRTVTTPLSLTDAIGFYTIYATGDVNVYGNVMSLIYGDNFYGHRDLTEVTTYENLFSELFYKSPIVNAENLILPATTLSENCYNKMFRSCTKLITAPKLPATTLAKDCYSFMFAGCTSLITAPKLPAITLISGCYQSMFSACINLTATPKLPATTLAKDCYYSMFIGCTALTTAPELPATTLATKCYANMFSGCTNLTDTPELPATTLTANCYEYMFKGCTSLVTAPELPATILTDYCYRCMFDDCSNLNYIKMLATDISATDCLTDWVAGVSITGTFVKNAAMTTLPTGTSGIPNRGWTVQDA